MERRGKAGLAVIDSFPEKQGLKLRMGLLLMCVSAVIDSFPEKQGLKHFI